MTLRWAESSKSKGNMLTRLVWEAEHPTLVCTINILNFSHAPRNVARNPKGISRIALDGTMATEGSVSQDMSLAWAEHPHVVFTIILIHPTSQLTTRTTQAHPSP